jgi:hypothetical protein
LHLGRHIHLRSLNLTVSEWQLVLWAMVIPLGWLIYRYVYRRGRAHGRVAWVMLALVVCLQLAAFVSFGIWRDADLLFALLWCSLVAFLAGAALMPTLRFRPPRRTGSASTSPP